MRNSEAQRYARWSLAAAGLLAVVVAGVYGRNAWLARQAAKKAPPAVPATVEQQSNEFSYSKVEGQRTIYTVKASRTTAFKEGSRNLLEDVDIVVYGKKGERNDTLRTKACDFISNTGRISCAGEVQISLQPAGAAPGNPNAIQVATSALTFDRDSGEARTEKPVTFRWPQGEGRAVGVNYDSNNGTLGLAHNVELNLSTTSAALPDNLVASDGKLDGKIVHVAGDSMSFQRDARVVTVNGNVHAQQGSNELHAGKLLLELDAQFQARRFVASGQPQLRELNPEGPIELSADEIVSRLRPDGSVESVVGTGNVHGTRNTQVGGDGIDAGRLELTLASAENLPQLLTGSNGVKLTSTSAAFNGGTRHVESDALEVHFLSAANGGQTTVESVNTLAPARVDWQSVALVNGKTVPQSTRMTGKQMNLKFGGQNQLQQLVSTGGVEVTRKLGDAPDEITASRELIANFDKTGEWSTIDQTGDVHFHDAVRSGQGDRGHVERASNTVTLDGSVIVADANTRTTAQSASFASSANTLRADGHVQTTDLRAVQTSIANLAPEPAHVSADHLMADTVRGHAVYSGKGRLWQGPSVIEGDTIELDSAAHTVVVKGKVRGVFPQAAWNPKSGEGPGRVLSKPPKTVADKMASPSGRSAPQLGHVRGGLLTYWENESRGRIEQDARVDSEQGSLQANQIDLYFSDSGAASGTKQLTRSVASGDVTVRQDDRRGTSDRAEYTASEGKFVLSEGKPTLYSSTGDTTTGRQLTFYFADDRILVDSADGSKTVTLHQVEK
ncbi:MAG TPA: LPS export ABC transporter periplasmic protein LptC [Candidatus Acidoferrales bacterium]|nr:LPS export ABC transporter periplasmic protein LptC [Candidatus Acidoferrales bacterium]